MIEVTNLTKKYGSHTAVDHLSFRVEEGQIYGFLGPNGAGKSTTMNIITGYLAATEGTVTINGKDIQKEPEEAKKNIGYLPEQPPVYMDMTVLEYLKFAADLKKLPVQTKKEQIEEVMQKTGIEEMKNRLIKNLSKGYRQRVGLAQAILGDPAVIILDEPTVGLDPRQIIEIRELIRSLGEKHTVILSSHILSEVSAVCDHIMIISHGKLMASDSPEGLQNRMQTQEHLELEVKGSFAKVKEVLSGIKQVDCLEEIPENTAQAQKEQKKQKNPETDKETVRISIQAKDGADIREEIFYCLAQHKLPIYEMRQERKSLEDIFLELTQSTEESAENPAEGTAEEPAEELATDDASTADADQPAEKDGKTAAQEAKTEEGEDA